MRNNAQSPDGGIGRRARLKIWLSQGSAGSIPVLGTKADRRQLRSRLNVEFRRFLVFRGVKLQKIFQRSIMRAPPSIML
jgi:hypothetical protein